ncbi:hypothetical protein, variant [Sphaeroforma arctica JP610]|uniref:C2H2-type domain-containing protein n=1 Tax=Sphaeroforma arctica JP610 TaxID=667725 RepID=A0A0L0FPC4_9EUKA|nr:hypothetical protein, variant [Sphaeroforma arctica JP610]KNC78652.1 hypothetical protein, variant [Sphaeroforma arctica JP610]|eukprot:XP_014152554.1 hypothetical protein, variant [Sphaeroforma arctica JP610]
MHNESDWTIGEHQTTCSMDNENGIASLTVSRPGATTAVKTNNPTTNTGSNKPTSAKDTESCPGKISPVGTKKKIPVRGEPGSILNAPGSTRTHESVGDSGDKNETVSEEAVSDTVSPAKKTAGKTANGEGMELRETQIVPTSSSKKSGPILTDVATSVSTSFGTKLSSLLKYGSSAFSTLVPGEQVGEATGDTDSGSGSSSVAAGSPNKGNTEITAGIEGPSTVEKNAEDRTLNALTTYEEDVDMDDALVVEPPQYMDFNLSVSGINSELPDLDLGLDEAADTEDGMKEKGKGKGVAGNKSGDKKVYKNSRVAITTTTVATTTAQPNNTTSDSENADSLNETRVESNAALSFTTTGVHADAEIANSKALVIVAPTPANRPKRACVTKPKPVQQTVVIVEKSAPKYKKVKIDHAALAAMKAATLSRPRGTQALPPTINETTGEQYPRRPPRRVPGTFVHERDIPIWMPTTAEMIPKRKDKTARMVKVDPNPQIQERTKKKLAGVVVKVSLEAPAQIPEGDNPDVMVCPRDDCSKRFLDKVDFGIHERLHTGDRTEVCDWDGCPKVFKTRHSYLTHHRIHTCTKHFACTWMGCGKYFDRNTKLLAHMRTHTGEKPYRCAFKGCGHQFAQASHMATHNRTHTGEKPYRCTWEGCDKSFARSSSREHHLRTHTGERPFDCTWEGCDKAFARMNSLVDHMRTHTGERPYKCQWDGCTKAFAQSSSLGTHWKIHTGEKPFICVWRDCDKRFGDRSGLEHHKRTHTGERPFPCNVPGCGKRFAQSTNLTRHMKTHTERMIQGST